MDADDPQMRPSSDADGPHMGPSRDADGPGLAASGRGGGGAEAGTADDLNTRDSERSDSDGAYHDDDQIKLSHKLDTHARRGQLGSNAFARHHTELKQASSGDVSQNGCSPSPRPRIALV